MADPILSFVVLFVFPVLVVTALVLVALDRSTKRAEARAKDRPKADAAAPYKADLDIEVRRRTQETLRARNAGRADGGRTGADRRREEERRREDDPAITDPRNPLFHVLFTPDATDRGCDTDRTTKHQDPHCDPAPSHRGGSDDSTGGSSYGGSSYGGSSYGGSSDSFSSSSSSDSGSSGGGGGGGD